MTKTEKLIYGIVAVALMGLIILLSNYGNKAVAGEIGDTAEKLNHLQDLKQACYDNLTFKQSIELKEGKERYCYQYDDEILKTREELSKLTHHDYMGLK